MEQKIITSSYAGELNAKIQKMIDEGWEPVGQHSVVQTHAQNRYAGTQHQDTTYQYEYAQTMRRNG